MSAWLLIALTFAAGTGVAIQAVINARLGQTIGHAVAAATVSFTVGLIVLWVTLFALRVPMPTLAQWGQTKWWMFLGGFFGALLVSISALAAPRLGAGLLVALIVVGQLIAAVIIDHFGWFGLKPQPVDWMRLLGVLLLLAGLLLIRRA